ncbi:hypothetical protein ACPOL_2190 [Acidisarcina polymorpha]|uniref:Uncharacterized protein n=1 Tax=Acidisarcina polymorpha TaxID=2211140 RepID=A0A2Z5FYB9_9BACT|nr:hypothetical protein ACPOL_2190 [Acidisarcina polymorpha]
MKLAGAVNSHADGLRLRLLPPLKYAPAARPHPETNAASKQRESASITN